MCGEPGAGKSSLIYSLIGRTFDRSVPRVLHPVTHPSLSGTNVYLEIYDTVRAQIAILRALSPYRHSGCITVLSFGKTSHLKPCQAIMTPQ